MTAPNPIALSILGMDIRWYGILIGIGFLLAIIISYLRAPKFGIKSDSILDLAIFLIPFSVIGARLYYVLFNWELYGGDFSRIINIRNGGLAIHGGLIAGIIVAIVFCTIKKIKLSNLADLIFPSVALAQSIGRWGNFFNSEAHGGPTSLPWAVMIDGQGYHPTFLYESIWCFILFCFLTWLSNNRKFSGQVACLYGILYSIERVMVEQLRTDSLMLGPFKQAQLLSITVIIICAVIYVVLNNRCKEKRSN